LTLAAMQITDQHQHQQQYTSIFGPSPRWWMKLYEPGKDFQCTFWGSCISNL
jgi:hypothetical protein